MSSRRDSESSNSSVNTLEDLSQAFRLTIAMGEESLATRGDHSHALDNRGDNDSLSDKGDNESLEEGADNSVQGILAI